MSDGATHERIRLFPEQGILSALEDFLIDRQARGLSPATVLFYREKLSSFCHYALSQGADQVEAISPALVRSFILEWGQRHNAGGVLAVYRSLRAFLNWWAEEYDPQDWTSPMVKVKPPRLFQPPLEPLNLQHLKAMLSTCAPRTFHGDRDRAMLLFLLDTGVRHKELADLNVGDLNLVGGTAQVRHGKGDKARPVFFGSKTKRELGRYLRHRPGASGGDPLWATRYDRRLSYVGLSEVVRRRATQAGVPVPSLHDFRRAFAIAALRAGCDLATLQRLLGHSSVAILSRYLKQVNGDLQAGHERVGPVDRLL